jgi:hypothetical protein
MFQLLFVSNTRLFNKMLAQIVVVDLTATLDCDPDDPLQPSKQCRDQLDFFESIVNSRWFNGVPTILLLNKKDIFEQHPLEYSFPNYTDGPDFSAAIARIQSRDVSQGDNTLDVRQMFLSLHRDSMKHTNDYIICATDNPNTLLFRMLKEVIIRSALMLD